MKNVLGSHSFDHSDSPVKISRTTVSPAMIVMKDRVWIRGKF